MDLDSKYLKTLCDLSLIEFLEEQFPNIPTEMILALALLSTSQKKYGMPLQVSYETLLAECLSFSDAREFWRTKGKPSRG